MRARLIKQTLETPATQHRTPVASFLLACRPLTDRDVQLSGCTSISTRFVHGERRQHGVKSGNEQFTDSEILKCSDQKIRPRYGLDLALGDRQHLGFGWHNPGEHCKCAPLHPYQSKLRNSTKRRYKMTQLEFYGLYEYCMLTRHMPTAETTVGVCGFQGSNNMMDGNTQSTNREHSGGRHRMWACVRHAHRKDQQSDGLTWLSTREVKEENKRMSTQN